VSLDDHDSGRDQAGEAGGANPLSVADDESERSEHTRASPEHGGADLDRVGGSGHDAPVDRFLYAV
jgi:hypothetical protein